MTPGGSVVAAATPLSVEQHAIQRRPCEAVRTRDRYFGCVTTTADVLLEIKNTASSSREQAVLVVTAIAPMRAHANQASKNSGQLSRCKFTICRCGPLFLGDHLAQARVAALNSPKVQLRRSPSKGSHVRKVLSGRHISWLSSSQGTSHPLKTWSEGKGWAVRAG